MKNIYFDISCAKTTHDVEWEKLPMDIIEVLGSKGFTAMRISGFECTGSRFRDGVAVREIDVPIDMDVQTLWDEGKRVKNIGGAEFSHSVYLLDGTFTISAVVSLDHAVCRFGETWRPQVPVTTFRVSREKYLDTWFSLVAAIANAI